MRSTDKTDKVRRTVIAFGVAALGLGPWLALPAAFTGAPATIADIQPALGATIEPVFARSDPAPSSDGPSDRAARFSTTGCTCQDVVVNASNLVNDAKVRSGNAKVVNKSVTFIAPGFGGGEVNVEQTANAVSGDAIAGQIVGVDARGGCTRVLIHAQNVVNDAEVRSGNAVARNKSIVLLDPSVDPSSVEVNVDQTANAKSGTALAGQILGVQGGGGPCGGVAIDALNRVTDTQVRSGKAIERNKSDIKSCSDGGCLAELRALRGVVDTVQVCDATGCHNVALEDFIHQVKLEQQQARTDGTTAPTPAPAASPTPTPDPSNDGLIGGKPIFRPRTPPPMRTPGNSTDTAVEATPEPTPAGQLQAKG